MADRRPTDAETSEEKVPPGVDTEVAHIARVYDYWRGGYFR
jgi:hypothetical protein